MKDSIPSKKQVKKAGEALANSNSSTSEYKKAMQVLSIWRSLHTTPLNTFQTTLRRKVKSLNFYSPIIAQRLKRTPSIILKLQRFQDMNLARMQDIGGLRIVLSTVGEVYRLQKNILEKSSRFDHDLKKLNDYIHDPKPDGYRGLHLIFRYKSVVHPHLDGLLIELQIRTKLQHSWATAVETPGLIEKSSFKTGEGDTEFKDFFKLCSALFAHYEKQPVSEELRGFSVIELAKELKILEEKLNIFQKLQGVAISSQYIGTNNKVTGDCEYFLVELNLRDENPQVNITGFNKEMKDMAESHYQRREITLRDEPKVDIVLISMGNVKDIEKAYPNYFLDTELFIENLQKICSTALMGIAQNKN